ncbi:MAG: glycosyltransferase family 2 protein [Candidatus Saccharibacteria bacterium]|nr:glycosyltransferase family 2 protein [Candidatus Saccharibacteria bacterium]
MSNPKKKISLVIPVFNEQDNLLWHKDLIIKHFDTLPDYDYEIIYVNDGSSDNSLNIIREICADKKNKSKFLSLSRNFGKEAATTAGILSANGDAVILMDADGQHPISLITSFIELWEKGYDIVVGVRKSNKGEGIVKKYGSLLFYRMLRFISGKEVVTGTTDFRLLDKKIVTEFNKLTERNRVTRNLLDWLGFNRVEVPFTAEERHAGKATYTFRKLLKLAMNGFVSHSTRPLKLIALLGSIISIVSAFAGVLLAIQKYVFNDPFGLSITGSALLALFVTFMVGIVLVCQGLLALYLESVYYETQNRPLYIVAEKSTKNS